MRFSSIKETGALIDFLQAKAKKHKFLYHFTTARALECICHYRTWRFSSAAKMNDMHEYEGKSCAKSWKNIYSTCFSFGDEDNIAMWAMYGIPWEDAVRLRVKTTDILAWIKDIEEKSFSDDRYFAEEIHSDFSHENFKVSFDSFHDICYYQGYIGSRQVLSDCPYPEKKTDNSSCPKDCSGCPQKCLRWWDCRNVMTSMVDHDGVSYIDETLVGFIKNSAWSYEHETRLVLKADEGKDYIDVPVPESLLKHMQVSIGPRSTLTVSQVEKMMTKYLSGDSENWTPEVSFSYYHQKGYLIQLRRHCSIATYKSVVFKNSLEDEYPGEEQ